MTKGISLYNVGEKLHLLLATCSPEQAEPLAAALLEEKLIGCANLIPGVVSRYWWDGEIQRDDETILLMETTPERLEAATARLRELHAYDVPKIIVLDPQAADAEYVTWLQSVTA